MKISAVAISCLFALTGRAAGGHAFAESPEAYRVVAGATTPILPSGLQHFFDAHEEQLQLAVVSPCLTGDADSGGNGFAERHYIMLDAFKPDSAGRLPRDRVKARAAWKRAGVDHGGTLPWSLLDAHAALTEAFRLGDDDRIILRAGELLHLATDAALPFQTTGQRGVGLSGDESEVDRAITPGVDRREARDRIQDELIRRAYECIWYEVRVFPGRVCVLNQPIDAVFSVLEDSHRSLADLYRIDSEILRELSIDTDEAFLAARESYYVRMEQRAAGVLAARLESGALLGANLMMTAWKNGGSPNLGNGTPGTTSDDSSTPLPGDTAGFVASRHSNLYHLAGCPHAKRIRPENVIRLHSLGEVRQSGRSPCSVCQPDQPKPRE